MDFDSFVLAGSTADLTTEPQAREMADVIEFRMDLAESPETELEHYDGELPIIATNRTTTEGGNAPPTPSRLEVLQTAAESDHVGAIDIELSAIHNEDGATVVDHAMDVQTKVIVSIHDFSGTPAIESLQEALHDATRYGTVGKLAVTAQSPLDVLRLLRVTWEFEADNARVATMAMGDVGRHSRIITPVYGSKIGYAPVQPGAETAPGQFDLETYRYLIDTVVRP